MWLRKKPRLKYKPLQKTGYRKLEMPAKTAAEIAAEKTAAQKTALQKAAISGQRAAIASGTAPGRASRTITSRIAAAIRAVIKKPEIKKPESRAEAIKIQPAKIQPTLQPAPSAVQGGHFMKRNINFSLFFLIIIILGALIGATSYYQNTYIYQSKKLQERTQEFDVALEELRAKREMLNETAYKLQIEAESKEKLGGLYTYVKEEKELVESNLKNTKQQLDSTLVTLESTRSELYSIKSELADVRDTLENIEESFEQCKSERDSYKNERDSCSTDFSKCCGGDTSVCS